MKALFTTAAAALLMTGTARAVDPPPMKEGLWSIHNQSVTNPGNKKDDNTATICRSHDYDQKVRDKMKTMANCKMIAETLQGNEYSAHQQCTVQGSLIDSVTTVTFSENGTHTEGHASYKPAMAGVSEMTMTQDQKFVGACPAGQKPGDVTPTDGAAKPAS
jgi:hypothetical protein